MPNSGNTAMVGLAPVTFRLLIHSSYPVVSVLLSYDSGEAEQGGAGGGGDETSLKQPAPERRVSVSERPAPTHLPDVQHLSRRQRVEMENV